MVDVLKDIDDDNDIKVETRQYFPSHFMVRIVSFSLLSDSGIDKYECTEFEAGGHKWKLVIYPSRKGSGTDADYVSAYLSVAGQSASDMNWEVNAIFGIFLHNQIADIFLYKAGQVRRRFHALTPACGFSKFISKECMVYPSNGYLVNDNCVFGAEVFVFKKPNINECLLLKEAATPFLRDWTISNVSKVEVTWTSENFHVGDLKWKVNLHPKGLGDSKDRYVSVFLHLSDQTDLPLRHKVKANFKFSIKDQINGEHHRHICRGRWFGEDPNWGWTEFMPIAVLNDPTKGFVIKDCCILEVEITILAVSRTSP